MNNVYVYIEIGEGNKVADVSLELLTKGRKLASELGAALECTCIGSELEGIEKHLFFIFPPLFYFFIFFILH